MGGPFWGNQYPRNGGLVDSGDPERDEKMRAENMEKQKREQAESGHRPSDAFTTKTEKVSQQHDPMGTSVKQDMGNVSEEERKRRELNPFRRIFPPRRHEAFRLGARVAKDPLNFQQVAGLTDEEKEVSADEIAHKWRPPKKLYLFIFCVVVFRWYVGWNIVLFFGVLFLLPETKGKTLEELDMVFSVPSRLFAAYGGKQLFYSFQRVIEHKNAVKPKLYEDGKVDHSNTSFDTETEVDANKRV